MILHAAHVASLLKHVFTRAARSDVWASVNFYLELLTLKPLWSFLQTIDRQWCQSTPQKLATCSAAANCAFSAAHVVTSFRKRNSTGWNGPWLTWSSPSPSGSTPRCSRQPSSLTRRSARQMTSCWCAPGHLPVGVYIHFTICFNWLFVF